MRNEEIKIWNSFLKCLEELPKASPIPNMLCSYLQKNLLKGSLHITMKESVMSFNDTKLDLTRRHQVRKIFEIFVNQKNENIPHLNIIKKVYSERHEYQSNRLQDCNRHNIVKLISRARKLAERTFSDNFFPNKLEWFPYDPDTRTWRLYSISEDHSF